MGKRVSIGRGDANLKSYGRSWSLLAVARKVDVKKFVDPDNLGSCEVARGTHHYLPGL
jgi:hypothetical protein